MATIKADLEITRVIDERPLSRLQILVIALCSVNVFIDGYDIQAMSLAVPSLIEAWGLPRAHFSWALSAAIFGGILGGAFLSPLGDKYGRRAILVWSTLIMAFGTFLTATATSPTQLILWRLIMGLGMGASVSNAIALTSEYMPAAKRARLITLMYCNIALGALTAGFVAPLIINAWTWQGIFIVGGILPLLLALVLYLFLPESVRFMMERRPDDARIATTLKKMAPDIDPSRIYAEANTANLKLSVKTLLTPQFRHRTLLIWAIFFLNMFTLYFLISWLPQLLSEEGWQQAQALRGAVLIQAGGIIGGLCLAFLVDRGKTVKGMFCTYVMTTIAFMLFLVVESTFIKWGLLLLVVGAGTSGAQFAVNALAASFYPPGIRATGLGWASAIGRAGASIGPLLIMGFAALGLDLNTGPILGMLALPLLICAAGILLLPAVVARSGGVR
ncbi:MAG TPA: MFS transporter [Acidobacteriota bacterium]|nr:MFS transporter [Acidobacteriota bacterium]